MRPWRKKSLPRAGDACIPLSALNEAPHGKVAQLVRACGSYPQCREFKSPPCYQKAQPRMSLRVRGFRIGPVFFRFFALWPCLPRQVLRAASLLFFKVYERAGPPPCLASRLAPALRVVPALPCWRLSQAEQRPKRLTELAFVPAGRHVEPRRGRPARALPFQASGQRPGAV